MLSVENQPSWMPSTIGAARPVSQELALSSSGDLNTPHQTTAPSALSAPGDHPTKKEFSLWGKDGFTFSDLVDVVNPLQHIPLISTFYRQSTGDQIATAPRVIGSSLFFGPIGFASAMANVAIEETTGKDIGEHMASWIKPDADTETQTASTDDNAIVVSTANDPSDPAIDPNDPVIAWARGEIDWAKQNAQNTKQNDKAWTAPGEPASDNPPIPDATPLIRHQQPAVPTGPIDLAQSVVLSSDLRSAAWAYEAAANLRS